MPWSLLRREVYKACYVGEHRCIIRVRGYLTTPSALDACLECHIELTVSRVSVDALPERKTGSNQSFPRLLP